MKFIAFTHEHQAHFMVFHDDTQHREAFNRIQRIFRDTQITNAGTAKISKSGFAGLGSSFSLKVDSLFPTSETEEAFGTCKNGRLGWGRFTMHARFICDAALGEKLQKAYLEDTIHFSGFIDPLLSNGEVEAPAEAFEPFVPTNEDDHVSYRKRIAYDLSTIYNCENY